MTFWSVLYSIFSLLTTVSITGFACFALIDYFRLRHYVNKHIRKETEDIIIDDVNSET